MNRRRIAVAVVCSVLLVGAGTAWGLSQTTAEQDITCHIDTSNVLSCPLPAPSTVTSTETVTTTETATETQTATVTETAPGPTSTVTETQTVPGPTTTVPGPTTTVPGPTTTVTVTPTTTAPAACVGAVNTPGGADPWGGCWPGPASTGVPAGTQLAVVSGSLNVTTNGTIVDGKDIHGDLNIRANNVTIRNTRVFGGVVNIPKYCGALVCNQANISLTDVEVDANHPASNGEWMFGEFGTNVSCVRCNIHGGNLGVQVQTSGYSITDTWVHDIWPADTAHKSAFGSNAANHVTARHNYLTCEVQGCSAALVMYSDGGNDDTWLVTRNHFNTEGSYCTYAGSGGGQATNITWTDNRYGRTFNPQCGQYGPTTGWQTRPGNVWSGNQFDDGTVINP